MSRYDELDIDLECLSLTKLDTAKLYSMINHEDFTDGISFRKLMAYLDIEAKALGNAGNDAFYTMQAFIALVNKLVPEQDDGGNTGAIV